MKKAFWKDFLLRGLLACAGGPVVLAIIYGILGAANVVDALSPGEVCAGVLSITLMAFIAAGITAIYQTDYLPLPFAISVHGVVLYLDYLVMYLFNDWIPRNGQSIGIFSAIFFGGFALIWAVIYLAHRRTIGRINKKISA